MRRTVEYPEWAEKYRGKGKTIRKVRDGYGLYQCTSVYDPNLKYPKSVQKYLGMITEKDGFVPKKSVLSEPSSYLEYGLSHFIIANFKRELTRSTFNGDEGIVTLGVIRYIFGDVDKAFIRATSLSRGREDELIHRNAQGVSANRLKAIANKIEKLMAERIPDAKDRNLLEKLLFLTVIRSDGDTESVVYTPPVTEITERYGLKL